MDFSYKDLYFHLFGKVSNTVAAIDLMSGTGNINDPEQILKMAQEGLVEALQEAEDMYLEQGEADEGD